MTYKVASLFSGCGGMDLGAEGNFEYQNDFYKKLNTKIVFSSDIDKYAVEIYNDNFEHKSILGDIRELKSTLPEHDILIGGFPCQSFSIVAQNPPRLGYKNDNGKLFFEMIDVLENKKPLAFIAENVKGLLSANKKQAFPLVLKSFKDAGYHCTFKVLDSSNFSIPQKRERVFIVGFRDLIASNKFDYPESIDKKSHLKDVIFSENEVDDKYFFSEKAVNGMLRNQEKMNKGRAQDPESFCNTITAHLSKASLNSVDPVLCIEGRYRRFTPREAARIQSFPDSFQFKVSDTRSYKAIGNAVPPVLMWHLMKSVIRALEQ
ncbi:DNA (cytosine-5-)-methyltransferase [Aliivibrio sp. S10_S31]|uniref:DNA (cytosine-5-)-methyltransferase n=1 Tax=Aliivibrio sp. S10_S31 TaxID=2720224 RepID=UPI001680B49C|nr:DNA (cytosine-5-)-methyltransferase [Aliivibrio sp. S10_S31]MBD1570335.1 DNA (cytosine-5-)-methyltransferase [Aliivibrio sp. S10_S31]